MSPVIKEARHRGKAPILGTLAQYLEKEEGREACLLLDSSGNPITAEDLTREFGGDRVTHWHSIVSPMFEDCAILTERHGGDRQAAAIAHGRAIAQRLERDTGRRVAFAVHLETRAGKPHFHFHFVGQGKARVRLYGRSGVIQRAWDRAWNPNQKPITNWKEQTAFLKAREELRAVQREMRDLGEERRCAIATAPLEQKQEVREAFKERELALIPKRYELEVEAINHRYAARNDLGSDRHQAELMDAGNRQKGAFTRVAYRGQPREVLRNYQAEKLAAAALKPLQQGVKEVFRNVGKALTVGAGQGSHPIAQQNELALSAAKTAVLTTAKTVASLALKAASVNPPGLAVQIAQAALTAPQMLLGMAFPDRGHLPEGLALPLRTASAIPGIGLVAKTSLVLTEATLKPILKETER